MDPNYGHRCLSSVRRDLLFLQKQIQHIALTYQNLQRTNLEGTFQAFESQEYRPSI